MMEVPRRPDKVLTGDSHGYSIGICHRPHLAEVLYENLPDSLKSRVLTDKRVVDVEVSEYGAKVVCADGSMHEGSIVLGTDGVRSTIRQHVQALQSGIRVEDLPEQQKNPYVITYRAAFGSIPVLPGLDPGYRWDGVQDGLTTQIVQGHKRGWFGVYEKLDVPRTTYRKYTAADRAAVLDKWADLDMAPGWKVRDVRAQGTDEGGLIELEEGIMKEPWYWRRLVLAGDAVRKMEPHAGLGYNCGVSDVIALANGMRQLLRDCGDEAPSTAALEKLFAQYTAERAADTELAAEVSAKAIRLLAWLTPMHRFMAKYVIPYVPLSRWSYESKIAPFIDRAPLLEGMGERTLGVGCSPSKRHLTSRGGADGTQMARKVSSRSREIILAALAVLSFGLYLTQR